MLIGLWIQVTSNNNISAAATAAATILLIISLKLHVKATTTSGEAHNVELRIEQKLAVK